MVLFMNYKRNNKRFSVVGRGEYISTTDFIVEYYTNLDACRKFFFDMKWPTGYYCEKCGCTHYYFMKSKNCYRCAHCKHDERLFTNTIFQDNKLPLNVLLYGLFLIFTAKKGISSLELSEELKVNYKTACLLQTKARILMKNSNSKKSLDSSFYESDVAYTGAPSHNGKRGLGTDKQPFLVVLSTEQENQYPLYIKLHEVSSDSGNLIQEFFDQYVKMSNERKLNTDGKTTYNILKTRLQVINEVIDYDKEDHRLYFLNKIISNLNQQLLHVYHGVSKRMLPLYYGEYEWRFNHRKCKSIMDKIKNYITLSRVATRKMIRYSMDQYATSRGLEIS